LRAAFCDGANATGPATIGSNSGGAVAAGRYFPRLGAGTARDNATGAIGGTRAGSAAAASAAACAASAGAAGACAASASFAKSGAAAKPTQGARAIRRIESGAGAKNRRRES